MSGENRQRGGKGRTRRIAVVIALIALAYVALLVPEREPELKAFGASGQRPFAWDQDAYWHSLEKEYSELRTSGCRDSDRTISEDLQKGSRLLRIIEDSPVNPDNVVLAELEGLIFEMGPIVAACRLKVPEYMRFTSQMRDVVKRRSAHWEAHPELARTILYRLLYGARSAVEEIILQMPGGSVPALLPGRDEPSGAPWGEVRNVRLHSGDILVSRGGAPTSALIARGNDYPGNFSHIAFVYVDPDTRDVRIVEAHIEKGVVVSTVQQYFEDKKLRIMLLRLRSDLPQILRDPELPHKAAQAAYLRAMSGHVPYDFEMNYREHDKLFCSEVASAAYEEFGVTLWMGISRISSPGLRRWLSAFGVRYFETQEPSDLEYDPQMVVVAEWRDPATLRKDRYDNAATEVMIEGAEAGDELSYQWYLLPLARVAKGYSAVLNMIGKVGPVPEGMSATAALRNVWYSAKHEAIVSRLIQKAEQFRRQQGYEPPYWELISLARLSKSEIERENPGWQRKVRSG